MEREQATLPFVVPSHLSKLFGLKASVIVEGEGAGGRDESERQGGRKRKRGGAPRANSTCWGDGETAVTKGGGVKNSGAHFFYSFILDACVSPSSLFIATNSPSIAVLLLLLPSSLTYSLKATVASDRNRNIRDAALKLGLLTNRLSGSVWKKKKKRKKKRKKTQGKTSQSPRTVEGFEKARVKDEK